MAVILMDMAVMEVMADIHMAVMDIIRMVMVMEDMDHIDMEDMVMDMVTEDDMDMVDMGVITDDIVNTFTFTEYSRT